MIVPNTLYHGSNVEVQSPSLRYSRKELDFGAGFYTTTDLDQAKRWAARVTKVRRKGQPTVTQYSVNRATWAGLSILYFEHADVDWLRLVVGHRIGDTTGDEYDIIAGPVADDRTIDVINQYAAGIYDEEMALKLLLPMKFKDQWALKSESSLSALKTEGLMYL